MAKVTGEKINFYEEDVGYGQSMSETLLNKLAKSIQWHNENTGDTLGKVEQSMLTTSQFCVLKGDDSAETDLTIRKWVLMSGQDITGSDLHTLTGMTTLPNATGNSTFFRQGSSIGAYQANQNKSHSHDIYRAGANADGGLGANTVTPAAPDGFGSVTIPTDADGGSESRPNNYQMNFFIKINW